MGTYRRFVFGTRTSDFEMLDLFAQCNYLYGIRKVKKYILTD